MKKILLLNSSFFYQGILFADSIKDYYDVTLTGNKAMSPFGHYLDKDIEKSDKFFKSWKDVNIKDYDIILGLDNEANDILAKIKKEFPSKKIGVQILDYPEHTFLNNKDFEESSWFTWENRFLPPLKDMDFITHCKSRSKKVLEKLEGKAIHTFIRYPVKRNILNIKNRGNFIVFSGRTVPSKGIHYIIDALALLEEKIEFIAIGRGFNYTSYAEHLNVKYRQFQCSEADKWEIYHRSRFSVCGEDGGVTTSCSILECIGIGRTGIVWDTEENRVQYGDNVVYVPLRDIGKFAQQISFLYQDIEKADSFAKNGPNYHEEKYSYEKWAENIYNFIESL